jgi:L-lactate dehydrogenase complex protein LldG
MIDRFQTAAEAIGAVVKRFTTLADAWAYLADVAGARPVAASALPAAISTAAPMGFVPASEQADAYLGVSFAQAGIAETGSLLLELADPAGRAATALPPLHAVFLRTTAILPDLAAAAPLISQHLAAPNPAYLSVTTGPSRTADIERVLTIGVHGPRELHILVLTEE